MEKFLAKQHDGLSREILLARGTVSYHARNVSQDIITDMSRLFQNHDTFNEPIGDWNVGKVTDMNRMFYSAYNFNLDIGDWNVDNVTDMEGMFAYTTNFNEDIGDWN
eukprot:UC4_evm1s772